MFGRPDKEHNQTGFPQQLEAAIAQALEHDEAYAVLAVVPQSLPGEDLGPILEVASHCVGNLVRGDDIAGYMEGEMIAVGLQHGDSTTAQVFASRLQGDLRLRSFHLRNTAWETGYAVLGRDGTTADELVAAAVDAARNRRRNMASRAPSYAITIPPALGEHSKF
jgi:hypothetical protein